MRQFWILDGCSIFYRSFHAPFRNLSVVCGSCEPGEVDPNCPSCEGAGRETVKATWLFTKMLLQIIRQNKPKYMAVVFDGDRRDLERRKIYPEYKKDRDGYESMPGIGPQLRRITQILKALGICTIRCQKHEADDYIATLAEEYASDKREIVIVSSDKDLSQCCTNPNVFVYDLWKQTYAALKTAGKRFGVKTNQILDYLMLVGDSADNIPGVDGFGPKTAEKMLSRYIGVGEIVNAAIAGLLPKRLSGSLTAAMFDGSLAMFKRLLTLKIDVPHGLKREDFLLPELDLSRVGSVFRLLEFREDRL